MRSDSQVSHNRSPMAVTALFAVMSLLAVMTLGVTHLTHATPAPVGLGQLHSVARADSVDPTAPADVGLTPPFADYRIGQARTRAAPTNQWYSTLAFHRHPQPLYAQPMTYQATDNGFEVGLPDKIQRLTPTGGEEISYPHRAALRVTLPEGTPLGARLEDYSDWLVRLQLLAPHTRLTVTVLHGSPYSYYESTGTEVQIHFTSTPLWRTDPCHDPSNQFAVVSVAAHSYAIYAPSGTRFECQTESTVVLHLPKAQRYLTVAGLPDESFETARLYARYAFALPKNTTAKFTIDAHSSRIRTTYSVTAQPLQGTNRQTIIGLYPHHRAALKNSVNSVAEYDSVRGPIKMIVGNVFTTEQTYNGIVPFWPAVAASPGREQIETLLSADSAKAISVQPVKGRGTYWVGKQLAAAAQLATIADVQGFTSIRNALVKKIEAQCTQWFDGTHPWYFVHDRRVGSVYGVPEEYRSISNLNDHHFHYGYWLQAAAVIAMYDPTWVDHAHYGPLFDRLIADIASDERARADYPYLRPFDAYESHSWAAGDSVWADGNNQESSSEAVNAWAALILYGELTHRPRLRDLGIYLYTSEIAAIETYWFDKNKSIFPTDYTKPYASLIFGGKYAYGTWWTAEPRQVLGINVLPITPASTYLAHATRPITDLINGLPALKSAYLASGLTDYTATDIWNDILLSFYALQDPPAALAAWSPNSSVEFGENRSHTLFWILNLNAMGTPNETVHADTPLYAVFQQRDGLMTYLTYNADASMRTVTFSDGHQVSVAAYTLSRTQARPERESP